MKFITFIMMKEKRSTLGIGGIDCGRRFSDFFLKNGFVRYDLGNSILSGA